MLTPTRKSVRDFWHERTRTILVIVAIALGIAAFASVMSSYAILTRELDLGYLATNPASAVIRMDAIDDDLIHAIVGDPAISDAEPRRIVTAQIKSGPIQWRTLILFVVKDYGNIRVSKLEYERGSWPPAAGELLIERDAFQVAHTEIGELVTVKTANGREQQLRVSGSVHDVGQAQARMENVVYGYITLDTLAQLGEQAYLDQLNILVADNRFDENHIREITTNLKKMLIDRGHQVRRIDIPRPGKHPHSDLMGVLLLAMSTFGLLVLALSGILVVNLLTAIMAAQIRQIGIMKAVGATRWQIAKIYLGQALLLGVTATAIALPLGVLGSRWLCRYMAVFLNFDINSFAIPIWVYLLAASVGIITPLLAASYPVWKGTRVSVLLALSDHGLSQSNFGAGPFDHLLTRLGGRYRPFLLSLRNSFRRRTRLALTLLTLSSAGLFFMSAFNIRASLINTLDQMFAGRKYDLSVGFASPQPLEKIDEAVKKTAGIVMSEGWFVSEGSLIRTGSTPGANVASATSAGLHGNEDAEERFNVVALPADTKLLKLAIVEGRSLAVGEDDAIVINRALAIKGPIKVGSMIPIRIGLAETTWRVVGISEETFSPPVAYIPLSFMVKRYPGEINSLRLSLTKSDADTSDQVKAALDENLEALGIRARTSSSKADSRYGFDEHMLMIYIFLIVMSVIIGGVGGLGLMTTMSVNVLERRREMGVLRAIGATSQMIALIVVGEGLVIALLSWIIAAAAAWPISKALGNLVVQLMFKNGLDFVLEWRGVATWFLVSLVLSAVATFVPAWRAARTAVRNALAYE